MSEEQTTIQIDKRTRRRLKVYKAKHDMTYTEAINRLLDKLEADTDE